MISQWGNLARNQILWRALHASRSLGVASKSPLYSKNDDEDKPDDYISIDRSALFSPAPHHLDSASYLSNKKHPPTPLDLHIQAMIKYRSGAITLAEYISEVLTNPSAGYYTQKDEVFGERGDFITSPEISQMFGEMIGIWCVASWQEMNSPKKLRIVELGPGRGTLMADLLRGTASFKDFASALEVHMVEVSDGLKKMQYNALKCIRDDSDNVDSASTTSSNIRSGWGSHPPVYWHRSLDEVSTSRPDNDDPPTLYIAHEFIDALPVHQFQKTERGWCERLVDIAPPNSPHHLSFVLSKGPTPAAMVLLERRLKGLPPKVVNALKGIEICPQGMAVVENISKRIGSHGGAALIIDYGQFAPFESSVQAIMDHTFADIFDRPGMSDISAWVDFDALDLAARTAGAGVHTYGPITQGTFLLRLGIEARMHQLMKNATEKQAKDLESGFNKIVGSKDGMIVQDDDGMGQTYKVFCIKAKSGGSGGGEGGGEDPVFGKPNNASVMIKKDG
jgi:NADH dehydrogenase [ubiquinone] 1 alpha subcomplex assembly factor 7